MQKQGYAHFYKSTTKFERAKLQQGKNSPFSLSDSSIALASPAFSKV
jgi:hypothetical protein